jgi:hypothetical protein
MSAHAKGKVRAKKAAKPTKFKEDFLGNPNAPDYQEKLSSRQEYAQIGKALGDCRFETLDCSGPEVGLASGTRQCHIIGSLTKRASTQSRNKRGGKHRPKPKCSHSIGWSIS